jgi:hypothetical protein
MTAQTVAVGSVSVETARASTSRFGVPDAAPSIIVRFKSQTHDYESFVQSNQAGYALAVLPPDKYCLEAFDVHRDRMPLNSPQPVCVTVRNNTSTTVQLLLIAAPAKPVSTLIPDASPYGDADAYEVYSAILPTIGALRMLSHPLIQRETQLLPMTMDCIASGEYEGVVGPALEQYRSLNQKPWLLEPKLKIGREYELVPKAELEQFYSTSHHIVLSAVGFNASRTIAVVYVADHSEGLGGSGQVYAAEKKNGQWVPIKWGECGWIS